MTARSAITAALLAATLPAVLPAQDLAPRVPVGVAGPVGGTCGAPSVAIGTRSTNVAWSNFDTGGTVWCASASGLATQFSAPVRVDRDSSGAVKLTQSDSCLRIGSRTYVFWIDGRTGSTTDDVRFNVSYDFGATFSSGDVRIPDGFGGAGEVRGFRVAGSAGANGDRLHVAMRVAPGAGANEELWYTRSLDGGTTWSSPVRLAGNAANGIDVDQFAIAISGDRVNLVWEDDSRNGAGRDSVRHVRSLDVGATFGPVLALDVTDAADTGDSEAPGEFGLQIRSYQNQVAVVWLEERTDPSNEEVRLAVSSDGGGVFLPDQRISTGNPNTVDADYLDLWLDQGMLLVAYTDDRNGGTAPNQVRVWRRAISGGTPTETVVSDARGASFLHFSGSGPQAALAWLTDDLVTQSVCCSLTDDTGATWTGISTLHDVGTYDADGISVAFAPGYDNAVVSYALNSGPFGENRPWIGGVRRPTLEALGFSTSAPTVRFRGTNLLEGDATMFAVVLALTKGEGLLELPDDRDLGTAYDAFTVAGLAILPNLVGVIQVDGTALTPALANGLPPGLTFTAVGITVSPTVGTVRITDPVDVVVN
ncbi:MAG: hypothetical protein R3F34_10440 [Planctomycetota bacterium]